MDLATSQCCFLESCDYTLWLRADRIRSPSIRPSAVGPGVEPSSFFSFFLGAINLVSARSLVGREAIVLLSCNNHGCPFGLPFWLLRMRVLLGNVVMCVCWDPYSMAAAF